MSNPELAAGFQNPKVQAAIMDISQNPMNVMKYQSDPEVGCSGGDTHTHTRARAHTHAGDMHTQAHSSTANKEAARLHLSVVGRGCACVLCVPLVCAGDEGAGPGDHHVPGGHAEPAGRTALSAHTDTWGHAAPLCALQVRLGTFVLTHDACKQS